MHRIRVAALGAAIVFAFGAAAEAQQGNAGRAPRTQRGERVAGERRGGGILFRDIALTDAQKAQVLAIDATYREQYRALRPADGQRPDSAARAQRAAQLRQIAQRQQAELRAVLTPAQQAQFDRNVAAARERVAERRNDRGASGMHGQRGGHGGHARERVTQAAFRGIELTAAQRTRLDSISTRQRGERETLLRAIRADGQRPDSTERARVRDLAQRQRAEVRGVLTPAQQQQFDGNVTAMRERARERGGKGVDRRDRRGRRDGGRRHS